MKIIFICSKSITFNTFLKSQANYLMKKGFEVVVACSDSDKLEFKNNLTYKINFPNRIIELFDPINYFRIFIQISKLVKKIHLIYFIFILLASHILDYLRIYIK